MSKPNDERLAAAIAEMNAWPEPRVNERVGSSPPVSGRLDSDPVVAA